MGKTTKNLKHMADLIFNNATLIIFTWDLDGRITSMNSYGEKITGYSEEELIGNFWVELFLGEEKDKINDLIECIKAGKDTKDVLSTLWRTRHNQMIDLMWTNSPIYDSNENIVEMMSFGTDITENNALLKKLNRLAYYDDLTNLPNRKLAEEHVDKVIERCDKHNKKTAFLTLGIDNLQQVSDTIGYEVANTLLKFIALELEENDNINYVSKLNEGEFGILIYDIEGREEVKKKAEELLLSIRQPLVDEGYNFIVNASIGISIYPDYGNDFSQLMKHSNIAMCKAKENGSNGYLFYNKTMKREIEKNIFIVNNIEYSIGMGHLSLHYQPIIDLKDNSIHGFEALIRWFHPKKGYIPPMEFISTIEESGQIINLTTMILESAFRQKSLWNKKGYKDMKIGINLSIKSFQKGNIYEEIEKLLEKYDISPKEIVLELTETAFVKSLNICDDTLKKMRDLGLEIALDDFGTGYSSLARLSKLSLGYLKIDKSFIDPIKEGNNEEALLKHIINLGHSLNLKLVAEGVETKEQMELLRRLGCDLFQGYYFAKPMGADEAEEKFLFLREGI